MKKYIFEGDFIMSKKLQKTLIGGLSIVGITTISYQTCKGIKINIEHEKEGKAILEGLKAGIEDYRKN